MEEVRRLSEKPCLRTAPSIATRGCTPTSMLFCRLRDKPECM